MRWLLPLAVACGLLAAYLPHVASAEFVYEDARYLAATDRPMRLDAIVAGRGLSTESWTVIRSPKASHALNLVLHLMAVLLVMILFRRLVSREAGMAVGAISALHPLTTEGVAYASSRGELMAAVGVLVALLCATAETPWLWMYLPLCLGVAYAGKETGLVGAALIPVVLWLKGERTWAIRLGAALGSAVFLYSATHLQEVRAVLTHAEYGPFYIDKWQWVTVQSAAVWRLVMLSVAPFWLSVDPPLLMSTNYPVSVFAILAAASCELAWRCRTSAPLVTCGFAWMALVALPRFFVRTPTSPFNEHQWYLAMVGVACVIVGGFHAARQWCDAHHRWRLA